MLDVSWSLNWAHRLAVCAWLALAICASPATANDGSDDVCARWAAVAAAEFGVPERLMRAITQVETARGARGAWPWAVNADGQGHWFGTPQEAITFVSRALADGVEQVDVGCFQLNLKWHGAAFASLDQMIEPAQNARYAARFLTHLHAEFGSWTQAAAAFHSRTPDLGRAYLRRVQAALTTLPEPVFDLAVTSAPGPRAPQPLRTGTTPLIGGVALGAPAGPAPAPTGATDGRGGLLFVRR